MDEWRLIVDPPRRGSENMARDYAILKGVAGGLPPTLRLYRWSPAAITIGYFQIRDDETDHEECARDGVAVLRRITGGGAVYHAGELTYSITIPLADARISGSVLDTYRFILQPIIDVMESYSINAVFRPVNDITVEGRKVSGSAQTRREGVLLQHGTVLLSLDRSRMFRYLKVSAAKVSGKAYKEAAQGITAMDELIGIDPDDDGFTAGFIEKTVAAFARRFSVRFNMSQLSEKEISLAGGIERTMLLNDDWNNKRKKINLTD